MKFSNNRFLVFIGAAAIASLLGGGCQSGEFSKGGAGTQPATTGGVRAGLYERQLREAAYRLMRDHPGMSLEEAYVQARSMITPSYDFVAPKLEK